MKKINSKIIIVIVAMIIIAIVVFYMKTKDENIENISIIEENEQNTSIEQNTVEKEENNKIKVYITGEINNPGLYEIAENSRIADAIEAAGNLTENAYIDKINLAYVLEDGMKIYIPNKHDKNDILDETATYVTTETGGQTVSNENKNTKSGTAVNTSAKNTEKVNINSATQTELETLPGIGSSTALKIINYRKENGKFKTIEEIKNVKGIGDSKYEKIKELIKV